MWAEPSSNEGQLFPNQGHWFRNIGDFVLQKSTAIQRVEKRQRKSYLSTGEVDRLEANPKAARMSVPIIRAELATLSILGSVL